MNDIWYAGSEQWVVYSRDRDLIKDFATISEMQTVAKYFGSGRLPEAVQFIFSQGEDLRPGQCLLYYICARAHFNFAQVLALTSMPPGTSYRSAYPDDNYQPEMFVEYIPERIKKGRNTSTRKKNKKS